MLTEHTRTRLVALMKKCIKGVIYRNDLIDWGIKIQSFDFGIPKEVTVKDFIDTAKLAGIKVAISFEEYKRLKNKYESICIVPYEELSHSSKEIEKRKLEELYVTQGLRQAQIAAIFNMKPYKISYLIKKYKLTRRI
ncbi:hypothetical protein M2651_05680 [Clostridium sp. SYSU_GA19001]|uniref:hypothetical protein n=1 Tax=Clostridium caldaquaticum TaxID=2940653 RepID=UPI0020775ED1|nr:hypothetical protein [Clostridium caldaquaticum]MCM8710515.1 hypothetical protein [Clostridium caldaquaticum]